MTMKASEITGMTVLSIHDGVRLGTVESLLFDPQARQVRGLAVRPHAASHVLGGESPRLVVGLADIRSIGQDAITVENLAAAANATNAEPPDDWLVLDSIVGLKVVDVDGKLLGNVQELELDPGTGRLVELTVSEHGFLGLGRHRELIPAAAIRSLGPQVVMVELVAAPPPS
jgi:sporulation protein YlmC with PRC-barrel domain